eukprot:gnl/TRDRNA2_/TRDRNA2_69701_c0_seq1.p1 gnl/TRDRNA2_/TRDRNA2_69701_c0~~gnl/TRDRNA2_/TRDRNA2_69701_c0_seq1.p1  ORF type:complete len:194 (+),score=36.72 gnl/TRDRNA2_/TRDRNA2_69701_c0_seq1:46-627(+)
MEDDAQPPRPGWRERADTSGDWVVIDSAEPGVEPPATEQEATANMGGALLRAMLTGQELDLDKLKPATPNGTAATAAPVAGLYRPAPASVTYVSYGALPMPGVEQTYGKLSATYDSRQGKSAARVRNQSHLIVEGQSQVFHYKQYSQQTTDRAYTPTRSRRKQETPGQKAVRVQRQHGSDRRAQLLRADSKMY